jgi:glycosyltransferase involved in cell wall biosynthesis
LKGSSLLTDVLVMQALRSLRSDILVTTRAELHAVAARFAPPEVTLVAQEHMHYSQRTQMVRHSVDEYMDRISALVVLTERDRDDYVHESLWPPHKVSVIPNAARSSFLHPVNERERLIVAAGRLTRQKGFDRLIDAFAPIARPHPDWRLEIFGKGPDRRMLQNLITERGISDQVHLMGWTDRLDQVFSKAAILALSSRYEGLPLVVIEAMTQGLPTVAFDCPTGPRELVMNGTTGFLVANGDVDAFTKALNRLVNNAALRQSMGDAARDDARRYQMSTVGQQWDDLFGTLRSSRSTAVTATDGARRGLSGQPTHATAPRDGGEEQKSPGSAMRDPVRRQEDGELRVRRRPAMPMHESQRDPMDLRQTRLHSG